LGGDLFTLFTRRATQIRILLWDRGGYRVLEKRLSHGVIRLPAAVSGEVSVAIDARELALILQGTSLRGARSV
jgi:hypothetical protein